MSDPRRLIVGITGASGIAYGVRLLELLRETEVETHLVVSRAADLTRTQETRLSAQAVRDLADVHHSIHHIGASIASGSFRTMGMVVIPCSTKTLAEIATGVGGNLITRAADVVLKERRKLVLVVRESPLSLVHLRNMVAVTEAGGIIAPPAPAFYALPQSVDELVTQTACRVLDLFDIETPELKRWGKDLALGDPTGSGSPTAS